MVALGLSALAPERLENAGQGEHPGNRSLVTAVPWMCDLGQDKCINLSVSRRFCSKGADTLVPPRESLWEAEDMGSSWQHLGCHTACISWGLLHGLLSPALHLGTCDCLLCAFALAMFSSPMPFVRICGPTVGQVLIRDRNSAGWRGFRRTGDSAGLGIPVPGAEEVLLSGAPGQAANSRGEH